MKRPLNRWMVFLVGVLAAAAIAFAVFQDEVDFADNPALLVSLSENGEATLDTYNGTVSGRLKDVPWSRSKDFIEFVHSRVEIAQRDKVAYAIDDGMIRIWYETPQGPVELNDELRKFGR